MSTYRAWAVLIVAGTLATIAPAASASAAAKGALPAAKPPTRGALSKLGTRLVWPLHGAVTTVAPGDRVTVTVAKAGRGTPRLVLYRVNDAGRPVRAVAGARGRRGRLAVEVPETPGRRYQLRLFVGTARFWGWLQTPASPQTPDPPAPVEPTPPAPTPDPEPPPAPAPSPAPTPGGGSPPVWASPGLPCPASGGTAAATASISASSGHVGDPIVFTIANTGNICLYDDLATRFERQRPDGGWEALSQPPYSATDPGETSSRSPGRVIGVMGETWTTTVTVWSTLAPGHYRLVKPLRTVGEPYVLTFGYDVLP